MLYRFISFPSFLAAGCAANLALLPSTSCADVLASESFETYLETSVLSGADGGTGFAGPWGAQGSGVAPTIVASSLSAAAVTGGDHALQYTLGTGTTLGGRQLSSALPDVFYVGALFHVNNGPWDQNNTFSLYLSNGPAITTGALTFGLRNSSNGTDPSNPNRTGGGGGHFMVRTGTGSPPNIAAVIPCTVTIGTSYYLVARYSKSGEGVLEDYDTIDLWINPGGTIPTTPHATMTLAVADTGLTTISHVFARTAALQTIDSVQCDHITIGTAWTDVVFAPMPELRPVILSHSRDSQLGTFTLSWSSVLGWNYRVEASETMEGFSWTNLSGDVTACLPQSSFTDLTAGSFGRRFYRVSQIAVPVGP